MNVILINEDNHGQIGVALNYYNAVLWLIKKRWIYGSMEVWSERLDDCVPLKEELGEDWADEMVERWTPDDFNSFWRGDFYLESDRVIGTEDE